MDNGHKFHTLDGLRGIAALAVMQFHMAGFFGGKMFPQGFLAVDFFFILSGFVLTFAYQKRLDDGWSTRSFLLARFLRLYPLYGLGLGFGFVLKLVQLRYGSVHPTAGVLLSFLVLGALVLPAPPGLRAYQPGSFPLNHPTWSLFFETVANLVHVVALRRRSRQFLGAVAGASALGMIYAAMRLHTMDFGWRRVEILYGIPRVLFSYTCGLLLFRVWRAGWVRVKVHPAVVGLGLLGVLAVPVPPGLQVAYGLVVTLVVFPLLLLVGAASTAKGRWIPVAGVLGTLSYSLYVLHVPVGENFERVWVHVRGHAAEMDAPWPGLIYTVVVVALSLAVDRVYDRPLRALLRQKLQR